MNNHPLSDHANADPRPAPPNDSYAAGSDAPPLPANWANDVDQQKLARAQASSSRINTVNEMAAAINQILDRDQIFELVGRYAKWLLDFDHCGIYTEIDGKLQYVVIRGEPMHGLSPLENAWYDEHPASRALRLHQPQLIVEPATLTEDPVYASLIVVPLVDGSGTLGALLFATRTPHAYNHEDTRISSLMAKQVAVALCNAQRYTELESAYKELRRAERMRDDFTNMVIHDLRNPLAAVIGSLSLLERMLARGSRVPPSLFERVHSAHKQINDMIDTMLDVSRLEAGRMTIELSPTDAAAFLRGRAELYRQQAAVEGRHFAVQMADELPPVEMDAGLIGRVLDNLVKNAFKHTSAGGHIGINVTVRDQGLCFGVEDDGIGIPVEQREEIFDKFSQVSGTFARRGTGLGLTFCRLAVEAHGGRIWLEDAPTQGSLFLFVLPVHTGSVA